jgi:hypothetical protein
VRFCDENCTDTVEKIEREHAMTRTGWLRKSLGLPCLLVVFAAAAQGQESPTEAPKRVDSRPLWTYDTGG